MPLSTLGEAALAYALERGWYVFPIVPGKKKPPLIKDQYNESSADPVQIRAWWSAYPEANIGLDCGKSGIVAIDADSEAGHGKDHAGLGAPLAGLMLVSGGRHAWETLVSRTPSGGEHYLFAAAPDDAGVIRTDSNNFGIAGIDVRAKGGYVVLPPSRVSDKGIDGAYGWLHNRDVLPLPRKLLSPPGYRGEDGLTDVERKLQSQDRITKGGRDNYLIAVGGKLRDLGFQYNEIRATLKAVYAERCDDGDDPFTEEDFARLAKSAAKYDEGKVNLPALIQEKVGNEPAGIYNSTDESLAIEAATFLSHYTAPSNWIVDGILQSYSLNQSIGNPKAGKSTLLRHLALSVAYGLPFLGKWGTQKLPVLYYTLQENKPHLRKWLLAALWGHKLVPQDEMPDSVPIDFIFRIEHRGEKAIKGTLERIKERQYGLVIIDMWGRYAGVESFDDYAENEQVLDALNSVAQSTGACILWAHHERKSGGGSDGFSGGIGSQSIRGAVYTTIKSWKDHGRYYIATEQRDGDDIPSTAILLDPATQALRAVGTSVSMALSDAQTTESKVQAILDRDPNMGVREIVGEIGGHKKEIETIMDRIKSQKKDIA